MNLRHSCTQISKYHRITQTVPTSMRSSSAEMRLFFSEAKANMIDCMRIARKMFLHLLDCREGGGGDAVAQGAESAPPKNKLNGSIHIFIFSKEL